MSRPSKNMTVSTGDRRTPPLSANVMTDLERSSSMESMIEYLAGVPQAFPGADRARFRDLVVKGGEVVGTALTTNIANARALVMLRHEGTIRGIAALKRPQVGYRNKMVYGSDYPLGETEYPYEFGYAFIEPVLQGQGLSHALLARTLDQSDGAAIFATVRMDNAAMRAALAKAGFVPVGRPYKGRQERMIGVLVRAPALV